MTEEEWNACTDPRALLAFLQGSGRATERKLKLFACGCARQVWPLLTDERSRKAVDVAERSADGRADSAEVQAACDRAGDACEDVADGWGAAQEEDSRYFTGAFVSRADAAAYAATWTCVMDKEAAVPFVANAVAFATGPDARRQLAQLLRDIFGPLPFRESRVEPAWLAWNGSTVVRLAQAIYDERRFDDMPILADALEDAGCADDLILRHCREQGQVHTRGCWVLDLLLGKS